MTSSWPTSPDNLSALLTNPEAVTLSDAGTGDFNHFEHHTAVGEAVDKIELVAATLSHDHSHTEGRPTSKLAQANTHESADTDSATTAIHHTLGWGANQAARGSDVQSAIASCAPVTEPLAVKLAGDLSGTVAAPVVSKINGTTVGNAATKNVGTTTGTVAAGNDSRFNGALLRPVVTVSERISVPVTTDAVLTQMFIPADNLIAGATYHVSARYTTSYQGTNVVTKICLGPAGTTSDRIISSAGLNLNGGGGGSIDYWIIVRSAGTSGVVYCFYDGATSGGSVLVSTGATTTYTVNTTVANYLSLSGHNQVATGAIAYLQIASIETIK